MSHEDRLLNLSYWRDLVSRQLWTIVICTAGVAVAAGALSAMQAPVYESACQVYLNRQKVQPISFADIYTEQQGRPNDLLLTQIQILQSLPILERAVGDLEARGELAFTDEAATPDSGWTKRTLGLLLGRDDGEPRSADSKRRSFIADLRSALSARAASGNSFITVTVKSTEPHLAAKLANAVVAAYIDNDREMLQRSADEAIRWLGERVREQREKVLEAEKSLRRAGRGKVEEITAEGSLATQEIARLQQALLDVRLRLVQTESTFRQVRRTESAEDSASGDAHLQSEVESAMRARIRQQLVDASVNLAQLRQRYGKRHPDVTKAVEDEQHLREELARLGPASQSANLDSRGQDLEAQVETLGLQEKELRRSLDKAMASRTGDDNEGMRYAILKREAEINRALYNEMLNRLNEITISAGLDVATAEVFEPARVPGGPISPDHWRNVLAGLLAGLVLGVAGAAVRDHLDQSIRNPEQANNLLRAPVLGMIPQYSGAEPPLGEFPRGLAFGEGTISTPAEAYRILRSHIEGALTPEAGSVIVLTSAVPGEGKSTTAANLAAAFAEEGRRVLLVDGDLRRPSLGRFFRVDPDSCLSRVIRGASTAQREVRNSGVENLDLLACQEGMVLSDGRALTEGFGALFEWARSEYERIIVDAPVVMASPGVAEMARAGASVVLVHRPSWVPAQALLQVREHMFLSRAPVAGVVLNAIRARWIGREYPLLLSYGSPYEPRTEADDVAGSNRA